jgi:hypothetical protein
VCRGGPGRIVVVRGSSEKPAEGWSGTVNTTAGTLAAVLTLAVVVIWFDARCLADLARTRDEDLCYLNRTAWALAIVATFPVGPMCYLLYAKGPRRYV